MCCDGQPCLGLDTLLAKINILLRTRVDNFYVRALVRAWPDIGSDDDEGVGMGRVPDTFLRRVTERWKIELDGRYKMKN